MSKPRNHLRAVPDVEQPPALDDGDEELVVQADTRSQWGAVVAFELPGATTKHPRLLEVLAGDMDRPCAVDIVYSGVRLAYSLQGTKYDQAWVESCDIVSSLLGRLGLTESMLTEHTLVPQPVDLED